MNNEDQKHQERNEFDDQFEENMHKPYTDPEEEYHAYPNRPMPWTMGFLTGVFSRYGRGMLLWALAGAGLAVALWLAYTIYYHNNLR